VLDALYQSDGVWMLVEFKTGRVQDVAEAESLLERAGYCAQAERYLAAADRLLDEPVRGLVFWLDVGGAVAVSPVLQSGMPISAAPGFVCPGSGPGIPA
jgi:ATP-dependent exoDNAse (exonuclease V) beta subunit